MITQDTLGRPLRDLRISVTDRCNFRCTYCMPRAAFAGHRFLDRPSLLTREEIKRITAVLLSLGVAKVRLTGGEPLLRADLADIVGDLASLGVADLAITTNGALLAQHAGALHSAGLRRVTVSLDTLRADRLRSLGDTSVPLAQVLRGIDAAAEIFGAVKLNSVVRRGVNDDEVIDLVDFARTCGHTIRFIEYMDVGMTNGWRREDVVDSSAILKCVASVHPFDIVPREPGAVATRYRFRDGGGEFGVISSVSAPFCGDCSRLRLSADGHLLTCLFANGGTDLRTPLREGSDDNQLREIVARTWRARGDRYSEMRESDGAFTRIEMSAIGG